MYYYLLHNKHTNTHDTIYASSEDELQEAVSEVSREPLPAWVITLIVCAVVAVVYGAIKIITS